jgi:hypothetical protein
MPKDELEVAAGVIAKRLFKLGGVWFLLDLCLHAVCHEFLLILRR